MKKLFLLCTAIFSSAVFAGNNCNEVKTAYYLYKAQKKIILMFQCMGPICLVKKAKSIEKNFCKAVNTCEPISMDLEHPCTEDNKLTKEARENIKEFMVESVAKAIEFIKSIGIEKLEEITPDFSGDKGEE